MEREILFGVVAQPPEGKCIFSPSVARYLLHKKHRIIDIKPDKKCKGKSIFVFEKTEHLSVDLAKYKRG